MFGCCVFVRTMAPRGIPNNIRASVCDIPSDGLKSAVSLVGNSTAIEDMPERVTEYFMLLRKAFLGWRMGKGIVDMGFTEAESNMCETRAPAASWRLSVNSSPTLGGIVVEFFRAVLSFPQRVENADECFILDSEAFYDINFRTSRLTTPTHGDLKHLVCAAIFGMTACLRFPGQLNFEANNLPRTLLHGGLRTAHGPRCSKASVSCFASSS